MNKFICMCFTSVYGFAEQNEKPVQSFCPLKGSCHFTDRFADHISVSNSRQMANLKREINTNIQTCYRPVATHAAQLSAAKRALLAPYP